MAKTQIIHQGGILVSLSKRSSVNITPPERLKRRVEQLLEMAKVGSGEYYCIIEHYYPTVTGDHPWAKLVKQPGSTAAYTLIVRVENEAFSCNLRAPVKHASPELAAALQTAVNSVCKNGWYKKPEPTPVAKPEKPTPKVEPAVVVTDEATTIEEPTPTASSPESWVKEAEALIQKNEAVLAELKRQFDERVAKLRSNLQKEIAGQRNQLKEVLSRIEQENSTLRETINLLQGRSLNE